MNEAFHYFFRETEGKIRFEMVHIKINLSS